MKFEKDKTHCPLDSKMSWTPSQAFLGQHPYRNQKNENQREQITQEDVERSIRTAGNHTRFVLKYIFKKKKLKVNFTKKICPEHYLRPAGCNTWNM